MLDKYCTGYNHLAEFIEKKYKVSDIALKKLVPPFITDFELFLKPRRTSATTRFSRIVKKFQ